MLNRKRDGVNGRYFLIHKPDTPKEILDEADVCIQDILDGKAREKSRIVAMSFCEPRS